MDDQEMIRLDPQSEALAPELIDVIVDEIGVRVALGQIEPTAANIRTWAVCAADEIIRRFQIRERTDETPLFRWVNKT